MAIIIADFSCLPNGEKAWILNNIISSMDDEEAYYGGWLYIWPDEESYEECIEDFASDCSYEELEECFIRKYKAYHDDNLFEASAETLFYAHWWDDKLGLNKISNITIQSIKDALLSK